MRILLSGLAIVAVAACSSTSSNSGTAGAGGSGTEANGDSGLTFDDVAAAAGTDANSLAFQASLANFTDDLADVDGKPLDDYNFTAFNSVDPGGSATYSGFINVNAGAEANVSAGLELTANFDSKLVEAEQTTAFYADLNGQLDEYDGELDFPFARIGARGTPNNVRLDIDGTLSNDENTIVVDGEILGKLVGTPIVGISGNTTVEEAAAFTSPDRAMNITLNGDTVTDASAGFVVIDDTLR